MAFHTSTLDCMHADVSEERRRRLRVLHSERMELPLPHTAPLVSVIVLTLNGAAILRECIEHLFVQDYPKFEIIIVDNASTDETSQVIQDLGEESSSYPQVSKVICIALAENAGVAGGRNAAVAQASGEVLAFIDNDGFAEPTWLREGVTTLLSDPTTGAVASSVFFRARPLVLNGAGGLVFANGGARDLFFEEEVTGQSFPEQVAFPMGCGMFVDSRLSKAVFPLETLLPKWFDDVAVGFRVWSLGSTVRVSPGAVVEHDFNTADAIITPQSWRKRLLFEKARIRTACSYFPTVMLWRMCLHDFRAGIRLLFSSHWREAPVLLLAYIWNGIHLKSLRPIRAKFRLSQQLASSLVSETYEFEESGESEG